MSNEKTTCRYFTTYSGVKLPFKLVGELGEHEIRNRNTFFRGYFDADGVLLGFRKWFMGMWSWSINILMMMRVISGRRRLRMRIGR